MHTARIAKAILPTAIVLMLLGTACTSSPTPRPSPSPIQGAGWVHQSLNAGDLTFDHPPSWESFRFQRRSSFSTLLVYMTNNRLHRPCSDGTCAWPIDRLSPGGVLVSWSENGFPGWTISKARGIDMSIGGRPAKFLEQRPGPCRQIGGDETITVGIALTPPDNYYSMMGCLREPGLTRSIGWVRDMLLTVRVKGAGSDSASGQSVRLGITVPPSTSPFVSGARVSLETAIAQAGFPIYRPNDSAASDASMTAVWIEQTSGPDGVSRVALEYPSGIEVIDQPMDVPDAKAFFQTMANEMGLPDAVQTVEGVPAMVISQNSSADATKSNPSSVTFIKQGVEVAIYGHVPVDELLRVAGSVN